MPPNVKQMGAKASKIVNRKEAAKARGLVTFTRASTAGVLIIPQGAMVQSPNINGDVYALISLFEVSFNDGENTVNVLCEAIESGSAYNLGKGYYSNLATPVSGVTGAINHIGWLLIPGADEEIQFERSPLRRCTLK